MRLVPKAAIHAAAKRAAHAGGKRINREVAIVTAVDPAFVARTAESG
jgi:hypothetical protein